MIFFENHPELRPHRDPIRVSAEIWDILKGAKICGENWAKLSGIGVGPGHHPEQIRNHAPRAREVPHRVNVGENFRIDHGRKPRVRFWIYFSMLYMATLGTVWHEMFHWDLLGTCATWETRFPMLTLWGF